MHLFTAFVVGVVVVIATSMENDLESMIDEPSYVNDDDTFNVTQQRRTSVHAFYYLWYEANTTHWNHSIIPHWKPEITARYAHMSAYKPPQDQGSAFRPLRGLYDSGDVSVIAAHMIDCYDNGVDTLAISWHGRNGTDGEGVHTDPLVPRVLETAELDGRIKISFHLEPYTNRTIESIREDLEYIAVNYMTSSAFYKSPVTMRPLYFVYDSYHIEAVAWRRLLSASGDLTIRNTHLDGDFIGLVLDESDLNNHIVSGGFDGCYTYFAADGFTWASSPSNWPTINHWASSNQKMFVPSIGPGYDDTVIRPWNGATTRHRQGGVYYNKGWQAALDLNPLPPVLSLTTYNEWGEGTQLEASIPYTSPTTGRVNSDYSTTDNDEYDANFYMHRTKMWRTQYDERASS